jgi:hypothetical protein
LNKFKIALLVIVVAVAGYFYIQVTSPEKPTEEKVRKQAMILHVEGDTASALIRYFSLEDGQQAEGVGQLPWDKTVGSASAKVSAETSKGNYVKCTIRDSFSDKILSQDGPGLTASCSYSTF